MLACAFVAELVDAQVVKTLGFLGVVGSSPTARAVLRLRAVAEQTQIGRCPLCWHVPSLPSLSDNKRPAHCLAVPLRRDLRGRAGDRGAGHGGREGRGRQAAGRCARRPAVR